MFAKGYGHADVRAGTRSGDATLVTRLDLKLFTGIAVIAACRRGQAHLDKDVNAYLDFSIPTPDGGVSRHAAPRPPPRRLRGTCKGSVFARPGTPAARALAGAFAAAAPFPARRCSGLFELRRRTGRDISSNAFRERPYAAYMSAISWAAPDDPLHLPAASSDHARAYDGRATASEAGRWGL